MNDLGEGAGEDGEPDREGKALPSTPTDEQLRLVARHGSGPIERALKIRPCKSGDTTLRCPGWSAVVHYHERRKRNLEDGRR